jgi:hypothetical protein
MGWDKNLVFYPWRNMSLLLPPKTVYIPVYQYTFLSPIIFLDSMLLPLLLTGGGGEKALGVGTEYI